MNDDRADRKQRTGAADRRTRYTVGVIKESFLGLISKMPFEKITVTELCRVSDINRGTFYLHYRDTLDVLDDLLFDMMEDVSGVIEHVMCPAGCPVACPLCDKIRSKPEYEPLFLDDMASARIISKISENNREQFITYMMRNSTLTFAEAEALYMFQISGCMTVNRMLLKNKVADWKKIQAVIDGFLKAGIESRLDRKTDEAPVPMI
ncbi:MAG: TetR/AcrR family transcriptional regulator [Eubacteriales bacterium]|nr:TetR/AcrR family transcriptional regulator [Eubacteriales bacterium]